MMGKLATEPFDSPDHLFEIKWDGTRCIAFVEQGDAPLRMQNRRFFEMRDRYPELGGLTGLPAGTVLDGEVVVLDDGKPSFTRIQQRDHVTDPRRAEMLARHMPAMIMAFDLLYDGGHKITDAPLTQRRSRLAEIVKSLGDPHVMMSEHVVEHGVKYFEAVTRFGLEGMMAKRLTSPYLPGKRTDDWLKIKVARTETFDVIGYVQREGERAVSALLVAMRQGRRWMFKGGVGTGFTEGDRRDFFERFSKSPPLPNPPKDGPKDAVWRDAGVQCRVRFFEKTVTGRLRGPVFEGFVE